MTNGVCAALDQVTYRSGSCRGRWTRERMVCIGSVAVRRGGGWEPTSFGGSCMVQSHPISALGPKLLGERGIDRARSARPVSMFLSAQSLCFPLAQPMHPGCWPTRSSLRKRKKLFMP